MYIIKCTIFLLQFSIQNHSCLSSMINLQNTQICIPAYFSFNEAAKKNVRKHFYCAFFKTQSENQSNWATPYFVSNLGEKLIIIACRYFFNFCRRGRSAFSGRIHQRKEGARGITIMRTGRIFPSSPSFVTRMYRITTELLSL